MKNQEKPCSRPGVLLYFEIWTSLSQLSYAAKGRMMEAIFQYAQYQIVPDFKKNLTLAVIWDLIRPQLDRDGERYERQINQRHYARYCRIEKEQGRIPLDFESWISDDRTTAVTFRSPTTTTTSIPTTKTSSSTTTAADTTAATTTTNIYQLTAPPPQQTLSPRQQEAEFEALRRERMQAVAGWTGSHGRM